jgi:predicted histidine transporter YuiF (NhaC family)
MKINRHEFIGGIKLKSEKIILSALIVMVLFVWFTVVTAKIVDTYIMNTLKFFVMGGLVMIIYKKTKI